MSNIHPCLELAATLATCPMPVDNHRASRYDGVQDRLPQLQGIRALYAAPLNAFPAQKDAGHATRCRAPPPAARTPEAAQHAVAAHHSRAAGGAGGTVIFADLTPADCAIAARLAPAFRAAEPT